MIARAMISVALAASLAGCAYRAETVGTGAHNVVTSYASKVPGKWLVFVEADRLSTTVRSSDLNCAAHTFPLDFTGGFPASVRATLPNVLQDVEFVSSPPTMETARARRARGVVMVRGEEVRTRLRIVPGFWSANIVTEVDIAVAVTVDGRAGRLFGRTIDGRGRGDAPAGFACAGGAASLKDAAEEAQRNVLRRIAEEIANSDRVRQSRR